jgi:hypothetical protein
MGGIKRENPLATNLRIQMPSCSQMAKACFVERSSGISARLRSHRRFAGGYPAFTTIHLHISGRTEFYL